jgi:SAM-dependent methyltransferase
MHPQIFEAFDEICRRRGAGGVVLEIGAVPSPDTLLMLPALAGARERIGLNLDPACEYRGCPILQGDAKNMGSFADGRFDTVLCNSVLEHEPRFWLILAEIRRVTTPGGLVVIGVPGYAPAPSSFGRRARRRLGRLPLLGTILANGLAATPTLVPHHLPRDYYRFSEQACRDLFMEGMQQVEILRRLDVPRFIASGRRDSVAASPVAARASAQ